MLKNKWIQTLLMASAIVILPNLYLGYRQDESKTIFLDRLDEDREICFERAKRDKIPDLICEVSHQRSKDAYRAATENDGSFVLFFTICLFFLVTSVNELRTQFEELKEKIK